LIASRYDWYQIKRSFQGLLGALKTVRFVEKLMEIWLNAVYNRDTKISVYFFDKGRPGV